MKILILILSLSFLFACEPHSKKASRNISKAADMFEIHRRVVFYNGINGEYMLTIEGKCSIKDESNQLEVTCKTDHDQYKKHFLGLSDNVTYFAEQMDGVEVSVYHNRIIWKPQSIVPNIDIETNSEDAIKTLSK